MAGININANKCDCCKEIWLDSHLKSIPIGLHRLHLCPNCYSEYNKLRTGHWIMTGDYYTGAYGSIDYVECSCCHKYSLEEGEFCPNCGAKMESEE